MQKIALIPAYCPESRMIPLLEQLHKEGLEIVVVDDGSGSGYDAAFESAEKYATVLRYEPNRGKGEALRHGMKYISGHYPPPYVVVTADADGQHRTEDIIKVSDTAIQHPDALVVGRRQLDQNAPIKSRLGNGLTRFFYRLTTGRMIYETQTGLRAFSDRLLPRFIRLPGHRYEFEIDMMLNASDIGIIETDIQTIYFDNNSATHFRTVQDTVSLNKEFIRYKLPSLFAGCIDYLLFVLMTVLSMMWLPANLIARAVSLTLKYFFNRKIFFAEKASTARFIFTSIIIIVLETVVLWGFIVMGMNLYAAKLIAAILMIGVSIVVRMLFMKKKYK